MTKKIVTKRVSITAKLSRIFSKNRMVSPLLVTIKTGNSNVPARYKRTTQAREVEIKSFYLSREWLTSVGRYKAIKAAGGRCQCCGSSSKDGVRIVVDHIKPVRRYWHLRFDENNLQVLCDNCNLGKGSWDETDWRIPQKTSKESAKKRSNSFVN